MTGAGVEVDGPPERPQGVSVAPDGRERLAADHVALGEQRVGRRRPRRERGGVGVAGVVEGLARRREQLGTGRRRCGGGARAGHPNGPDGIPAGCQRTDPAPADRLGGRRGRGDARRPSARPDGRRTPRRRRRG